VVLAEKVSYKEDWMEGRVPSRVFLSFVVWAEAWIAPWQHQANAADWLRSAHDAYIVSRSNAKYLVIAMYFTKSVATTKNNIQLLCEARCICMLHSYRLFHNHKGCHHASKGKRNCARRKHKMACGRDA
jgi:hypothetical protein